MGENAQKIGKKLEIMGTNILELFCWNEKMRDKEIECRRQGHKNTEGKKKKSHGVDIYFEYEDPYSNKKQGIFVECKNRQWDNVNKSNIEYWIHEEINLMECAANNSSLMELYDDESIRNCALILINVNDGKYKKSKFYEYLNEIQIPNKRTPFKIFLASNDILDRWNSINIVRQKDYNGNLKVIYPSIGNSKPLISSTWTISHLFSKYVFCEAKELRCMRVGERDMNIEQKKLVTFCSDIITADSINYLWSICRFYQYENAYDEFVFYFYPENDKDVDYINENFISILKSYRDGIEAQIIDKISYKFLRNSSMPVVNNM